MSSPAVFCCLLLVFGGSIGAEEVHKTVDDATLEQGTDTISKEAPTIQVTKQDVEEIEGELEKYRSAISLQRVPFQMMGAPVPYPLFRRLEVPLVHGNQPYTVSILVPALRSVQQPSKTATYRIKETVEVKTPYKNRTEEAKVPEKTSTAKDEVDSAKPVSEDIQV